MRNTKSKTPYETPEIKMISLETERVLEQSGPGGFFGDEDSFIQSQAVDVFN